MIADPWPRLVTTVGLACLLLLSPGCKEEPPPPPKKAPRKVITLRVVMLVETGANLDSPPSSTGGCKLTRTEVTMLVNELVAFGNNAAPGVVFLWNGNVQKLESDCMKLLGFPFPPCFSQCSLTGVPDNCPRKVDVDWYTANVVNHAAGGPAGLVQADNYVNDDCTINIYFVGNGFVPGTTISISGVTSIPSNPVPDFVLITDFAFDDPDAPAQPTELQRFRTLLHESVCHWLRDDSSHPVVPAGVCPHNLCIGGQTFQACTAEYGAVWPSLVPQNVQDAISA